MKRRSCAYCGRNDCHCTYRANRKRIDGVNNGSSVTVENLSKETTLAEFLQSIQDALPVSSLNPKNVVGTWKWSFSKAEPTKPLTTKGTQNNGR